MSESYEIPNVGSEINSLSTGSASLSTAVTFLSSRPAPSLNTSSLSNSFNSIASNIKHVSSAANLGFNQAEADIEAVKRSMGNPGNGSTVSSLKKDNTSLSNAVDSLKTQNNEMSANISSLVSALGGRAEKW